MTFACAKVAAHNVYALLDMRQTGALIGILPRMGSCVIYVELLDEGVEVYTPVEAEAAPDGSYVLPLSAPKDETWAFPPGARVTCERRGADLYATSVAGDL